MEQLSTSHVFISYSRRDSEVMQRIVSYLRGQGLKVWVDNEKLVPGTPIWEREIEKAIDAAYTIVVVLSPDAKESVWVLNELTLADEYKKRVFPVLVRGDIRDSIPFRLVTRQFVDIRNNEMAGLNALSTAISNYIDELRNFQEDEKIRESEEEKDVRTIANPHAAQEVVLGGEDQSAKIPSGEEILSTNNRYFENKNLEGAGDERLQTIYKDENTSGFPVDSESSRQKSITPGTKLVVFLFSWYGRMLSGAIVFDVLFGISLALISWKDFWHILLYDFPKAILAAIGISLLGSLTGLIFHPHRISTFLVFIGIVIVDRIYFVTTVNYHNDPPLMVFAQLVAIGLLFGTPSGALLSRILYWLKILK